MLCPQIQDVSERVIIFQPPLQRIYIRILAPLGAIVRVEKFTQGMNSFAPDFGVVGSLVCFVFLTTSRRQAPGPQLYVLRFSKVYLHKPLDHSECPTDIKLLERLQRSHNYFHFPFLRFNFIVGDSSPWESFVLLHKGLP
jgi:hypothetical protein